MKKILLLALLVLAPKAWAQRSVQCMPLDASGNVLAQGLGLPWSCQVTVTAATYTGSAYCDLPADSGNNKGRAYRHFYAYNPSSTRTLFVCLGTSAGCSTETTSDMVVIPPTLGLAQDSTLYGALNATTRVWFRLDSTGSVVVSSGGW